MKKFATTEDIPVPKSLIDQVIGQDDAVRIVKKAAKQKRNVLFLGPPGTGKSMLAQGMAELMPATELEDILVYPNMRDENRPLIRKVKTYPSKAEIDKDMRLKALYALTDQPAPPAKSEDVDEKIPPSDFGQGRRIVQEGKIRASFQSGGVSPALLFLFLVMGLVIFLYATNLFTTSNKWFILASVLGIAGIFLLWRFTSQVGSRMGVMGIGTSDPKLIIDNSGKKTAPFVDATGAKAGALLGDVKHDPLQCIPGDERIHLKNGKMMKICELVDPLLEEGERELKPEERFEVLGGCDMRYCYATSNVYGVYKRKFDGEICEIETRRGHKIRVTPNHPLAFIRGDGTIDYTEAENLTENTHLVLPYRLPIYKTADANPNFITFIAYLLADGYLAPRSVGFKVKRDFKIDAIEQCLKANNFNYKKRVYDGATIFNINSAAFVKKLTAMGVKKNNRKSIPAFIYDLDRESISSFISSYMSLDGYVNKQGQFELFSKEFVEEFTTLLLKIGVRANINERIDTGFGKERKKIQEFLLFNNYEFASYYAKKTVNPYHKRNLELYLSSTSGTHVTFADEIPLDFDSLEQIRERTGLSQTKVHEYYYALKPGLRTSQSTTRLLLASICTTLLSHTNCPEAFKLKNLSEGSYSFDKITKISKKKYSGYVYNLTTETGNYLVNNVLTHNSGGLGTPPHSRVESGAIHAANKGVLFIDEVASLKPEWQQALLTAMQEKMYSITGQSELSSGALVKTDPVPCDFVLVAAGNVEAIRGMHPALRSRIRGNGYEVYVEESMPDTPENESKLVQFVAQEVRKDGKIPHFTMDAVIEIIDEARRKAGRKKRLTLNLRELGGLVRAAGDIAVEKGAKHVTREHVLEAKGVSKALEGQIAQRFIESKKDYEVFLTRGYQVGKINGLAVLGDGGSGLVLPIVAEVTPSSSRSEGKMIATGKLGEIAKEAVENVSAIIKKYMGKDISQYDFHVQFLQTYEGVEGDSAAVSVAVAVISAMENIPINQNLALTGSISVRGEVLPVGGVTPKAEAAAVAGIRHIVIPKANSGDVFLSPKMKARLQVHSASNIIDVLKYALKEGKKKKELIARMESMMRHTKQK